MTESQNSMTFGHFFMFFIKSMCPTFRTILVLLQGSLYIIYEYNEIELLTSEVLILKYKL